MRLDKFIQQHSQCGKSTARSLIARGLVSIDGRIERDNLTAVTPFHTIHSQQRLLQQREAHYLMLNKPAGCVSATTDSEHSTVIDLIHESFSSSLHIAGRLDKESTGLLILTNDGTWSRLLTEPEMTIPKRYLVTTAEPISPSTIEAFNSGFYFAFEDITTQPAELEIHATTTASVTIHEGKYHQIKRMFHAVGNRITSLHRSSIGNIILDPTLAPGQYRRLTPTELNMESPAAEIPRS